MRIESRVEVTDAELARVTGELSAHGSNWSRRRVIGQITLKHFFGGTVNIIPASIGRLAG